MSMELKPGDGWIEWNGGKCPVPLDSLVDYCLGDPFACEEGWTAGDLNWETREPYIAITHYRPHSPSPSPNTRTNSQDALIAELEARLAAALPMLEAYADDELLKGYSLRSDEIRECATLSRATLVAAGARP